MFIKITRTYDGKPMLVNIEHIAEISPTASGTLIVLCHEPLISYETKESFEALEKKIEWAQGRTI